MVTIETRVPWRQGEHVIQVDYHMQQEPVSTAIGTAPGHTARSDGNSTTMGFFFFR